MNDIFLNKRRYRPEIDGLRAFAVVAVIINHFNKDILPSGYLGVDIFFVISGYVITSSLAARRNTNFKDFILSFFERRIKRIVPALIPFTIITGILICLFSQYPGESLITGITSLFGLSNFYLLHKSTDYFANTTLLNAFTHTWSLDVEEQFYIVFPLIIWFSGFAKQTRNSVRNLFMASLFFIALSIAIYIYLYQINQSAAYFLMPARFWEMASGCTTYLLLEKKLLKSLNFQKFNTFILSSLLIGVLFLPVTLSLLATFSCVFLTCLLIFFIKEEDKVFSTLTNKFSLHIGKISYSLYLWHWTILCISRWTIGINFWTIPFQIALIYIFALSSYKFIELPYRNKVWSFRKWKTISKGIIALSFSTTMLLINGKFNEKLYLGKLKIKNPKLSLPEYCSGKEINFDKVLLKKLCMNKSDEKINFLAIGDSQTWHLIPLLKKLNLEYKTGLFLRSINATIFPSLLEERSSNTNSKKFHKSKLKYLENTYDFFLKNSSPGDVLLLSSRFEMRWGDYIVPLKQRNLKFTFFDENNQKLTKEDAFLEWKKKFSLLVKDLNMKNVNIIVFSSFPTFATNSHRDINPQWFNFNSTQKLNSMPRKSLKENYFKLDNFLINLSKKYNNVFYFDMFNYLCPENQNHCYQNENYRDQWHLSEKGSLLIYKEFVKFLKSNDLLS